MLCKTAVKFIRKVNVRNHHIRACAKTTVTAAMKPSCSHNASATSKVFFFFFASLPSL